MKILTRLEKSKQFWALLGISILFFLLRAPSLIEPDWYTDEGIYQVVGRAIAAGRILYAQIWDNKPPLLYYFYAIFDGDLFWVKLLSICFGIVSMLLFYILAQRIFTKPAISIPITILFTFLFGTPLFEGNVANAENFMLLPIIASAIIFYPNGSKPATDIYIKRKAAFFFAGFLLGIAFLIKIVAVFDFTAFIIFYFIYHAPNKLSRQSFLKYTISYPIKMLGITAVGFIAPIAVCLIYFASENALFGFFQSVFLGNISYVTWGNEFVIPYGLLVAKTLLICAIIVWLFIKRGSLSKRSIFISVWLCISLYNAFFSERGFYHYLLVIIPSFCLFIGLIPSMTKRFKLLTILAIAGSMIIVYFNFGYTLDKLTRTVTYYPNAIMYATNNISATTYQNFFNLLTPRDYAVSEFITQHIKSSDQVFIWGDEAQIYALSNTLPPGRFVVAYHITLSDNNLQETQEMLDTTKPKYIIVLAEAPEFPFVLYNYTHAIILDGAVAYERVY